MIKLSICNRCEQLRPKGELNVEGSIHHGTPLECLDRKACERRKRKDKKKKRK